MSFDFNLPTTCNHKVFRELSLLGDDRRTLRVSKPMAAVGNLELYASGDLVPRSSYGTVLDPNSLISEQTQMIRLNAKWKSIEDYFQVTYSTLKGFCPKCVGLGVLDDLSWNVRGELSTTRDEKLLSQNLEKFVVTELGSNPFHTFVGTSLSTLIGQRIYDFDFLANRITQEVNSALGKFKDLQQQYAQTGRPMTRGEQLAQIRGVKVSQDTEDPTIVRVDVRVTALSGMPLQYTQYLKTPE